MELLRATGVDDIYVLPFNQAMAALTAREFMEQVLKKQLGVEGNTFAYAYVIAHEIGHHVEYSLGILGQAHEQMRRLDKKQANQVSVRLELLADYYAGVWAHYEDAKNHSLEYGDMEKGLELAKAIGDDWLQKQAQGYAQPESFTHGTSAQRKRWLKQGFDTGDMTTTTFKGDI
jgi:predicted metalloprotease